MTVTQHTCITLACDVCGETFTDADEGGIPHFDTVQEARDYQDAWDAEYRWIFLDDGYALCPDDDESHSSVRESLKPAVPVEQVHGQQELTAVHGYRIGDTVKILRRDDEDEATLSGLRLVGRVGVVHEFDAESEHSIGLSVLGWLGLVWCTSSEIRHVELTLDTLTMTWPAPREFDPCLIRFERRGQEIWANFFDADGKTTGTTRHPGDMAVADLVAYYEQRGWMVSVPEPVAEAGAR